jgi:hypothetical protein
MAGRGQRGRRAAGTQEAIGAGIEFEGNAALAVKGDPAERLGTEHDGGGQPPQVGHG